MNGQTTLTTFNTPKKVLLRMQLGRLGKILFGLQFNALSVIFASVLSAVAVVVFYFLMIAVTISTLGLIFAAYPDFANWWAGGEVLQNVFTALASSWTYVIPISIALAISSIICLCFDYREKHKARIVVSAIIGVLSVAVLIIKLVSGGA